MKHKFDKYLEIELLMNKLFETIDFCKTKCIDLWSENGCCNKNYFNDFYIDFNHERRKLYWKPITKSEKCWYNCNNWCKLNTFKSPICLGFLCSRYIKHLRLLWIDWKSNEIIDILWELINQNFTRYEYLKKLINSYIKVLETSN